MRLTIKPLLLLILILLNTIDIKAQSNKNKYENLWKRVDELVTQKGLTKDALAEVEKIYVLAKKEKQDAQLIKALIYQVRLRESVEENAAMTSIHALETEIKKSTEPAVSILNSILAEKYWNYFQQHRWQLYNRTQTARLTNTDIAAWSIPDFHAKISTLYLASIKNEKILQQTKLEAYDPIIIKGNTRYLRPTLYDLLAFRALDYFRNDERDITKPAYAFEIKDENLFSPAATFSKLPIKTNDSLSLHQKALLVYQDLITFHAGDNKPDALIDADISRIQIVYQYGVMENKELLYAKALEQISNKYPNEPAATQASFLLAEWHAKNAAQYDPLKDTANRYEYLAASVICEKIIAQNKESEGKSNSMALLQEILHKELILQTEKINLPDQPFRTLVHFRNFTRIYLRIVPITETLRNQLNNRFDDSYWRQLTSLKSIRNWNQQFPSTKDYQKHSTEIKVDALPVGAYILLASVNEDFSVYKNPLAVQYFHVSAISYINNNNEYFVLDRQNGKPLAKADVQVWYQKYDYNVRQYLLLKAGKLSTDNNGYFKLAASQERQNNNVRLEITYRDDRLFLEDNQYTYYRDESNVAGTISSYERKLARAFFFTDRAIYRPGQTVFFKGIVITKDIETKRSKIYAGQKTIVKLYDANGQPSDSVEVTTNEYGSYSGKFLIPQNVLNGEFRLKDESMNGETSFSVEEYKRPKFYVDYQKIKGTYKVNDSISVTGFAKAYAGNNIDGARVAFRIVREPKFIYPWLYWRWGMPRASNMEIANGVITTGVEGKFVIRFKAIPDLTINKQFDPVFDFKVIADITDINGETRSGEVTIPVSYKMLQLKLNVPSGQILPLDSFRNIAILSQNLNGEFEPVMVHLTIHRLAMPSKLIRERYWTEPDQFVIGKEEYEKLFPYDEYQHESNYRSWNKTEQVFETSDYTKLDSSFEIRSNELKEGWYVIEATTKDRDGAEVKDVQYIQLYDDKSKKTPSALYAWNTQNNKVLEPGTKSSVTIGSAATDLFVIQQIDKEIENNNSSQVADDSLSSTYSFIPLNNEKKSFDFAITEKDRGGFGVYHFFVKNNRFYVLSNQVIVPWTNKELAISYETFRDKTLPGSDEKWRLKISGYKKEKVAAEMLASMYDASLDQFRPHSWMLPDAWPSYGSSQRWNGLNNFVEVQSQQKFADNDGFSNFIKTYDRLISPNADQYRIQIRGRAGMLQESVAANDDMATAKIAMTPPVNKADTAQFVKGQATSPAQAPVQQQDPSIQIRKNFNETAFFIPDLKTDLAGNIEFGFTVPEALTRWKFQGLAITKEAALGYTTKDIITQKQLMVQPNAPRFLREGDRMELSTKIVNMTAKEITGTAHLELFNATTMQPVDGWFQNMTANQYFTAEAGQSITANFTIQVPYQFNNALIYRFTAKAPLQEASDSITRPDAKKTVDTAFHAYISDAEEASLPVLTNTMLVTESIPLPTRGSAARNFRFEKLLQSGASETMHHHALTLEFTANPAWYAVQSLPFLAEKMYECSEQSFNRFYANALAGKIANSSPRILAIFEKWKLQEGALASNLEKNPELKSVLLEETPWVLDAKNEALQRKNIALLFDMARMSKEFESSLETLRQFQSPNGGFSWFKGGPDDRFITQYIITGIGHLKKLDALSSASKEKIQVIIQSALSYLDKRLQEDYANLLKYKSDLKANNLSYLQVQYLYMRSFFNDIELPVDYSRAVNYYRQQSQQFWLRQNRYMQGMIALSLFRKGDDKIAGEILKSLQQNAIVNEEMGMYWKEISSGYYWYQAPVETQSLLIEAFSEIGRNNKTVDDLKTWLLKQKQTQNWRTTKATADACYALLLEGTDWLSAEPVVEIKLGDKIIKSNTEQQQAGSGYFRKVFDGPFVSPSMGEISVKVSSQQKPLVSSSDQNQLNSAWGAVYWQYFEDLDKITSSATPLKLVKKLFVEKNSDRGPILVSIHDGDALKPGDKIKVRIELSVDRDMEYVHMKDMRAACMEPVNVLSNYKWQGGLGYYESTKDASTNFFFNWLPKGSYVFEYPLFVTNPGNFSNGVTSIQCMYAPEFSSHSEGIRVNVE